MRTERIKTAITLFEQLLSLKHQETVGSAASSKYQGAVVWGFVFMHALCGILAINEIRKVFANGST